MNILIVPLPFPSGIYPLSGSFVREQCDALRRRGHRVTVLHPNPVDYKKWFPARCFRLNSETRDGIRIYSVNYPAAAMGAFPRFASLCYRLCLKRLWRRYRKENGRPDLIHAHFSPFAGYHALSLSGPERIPVAVTEHYDIFLSQKLNPYVRRMLTRTIDGADAFLCVSEKLKRMVERHYGGTINAEVVPNMVDPVFCFRQPVRKDGFLFFSAGSLTPPKKMDLLIRAFAAAFREDPSVKLEIAGEGEMSQSLRKLIEKLDRKGSVFLLGGLSRGRIAEKMAECDAFVMLSERETFGIVYREAMAVGRPVVAAENGSIEENWDDMQGILIPPNDAGAAVRALRQIKNNIHRYSAEKISERCLSLYSADRIAQRLERIYRTVILSHKTDC